ncbi:type II toxin-antitoxin system RelE/ParE family toxin [Allostella humosa]|uniref:type II toxin-antitoxin system RelE/ParE family toxin n=1 Tax=Stella humosa TaxID=94 RepID=UPI001FE53D96|nr:type II toxin-antitoxin system RelE/ParE family toxin [Stella humosa]
MARRGAERELRVVWSRAASEDRRTIRNHIKADSPQAAIRMDGILVAAAGWLAHHPEIGQPGRISGTREFVQHPSYRLVYSVEGQMVVVLAVIHTARSWPPGQS